MLPKMPTDMFALLLSVILSAANGVPSPRSRSFGIENNTFVRDGTPMQILSGELHYSRIHPEYWRDRLMRMKALGFNSIATCNN